MSATRICARVRSMNVLLLPDGARGPTRKRVADPTMATNWPPEGGRSGNELGTDGRYQATGARCTQEGTRREPTGATLGDAGRDTRRTIRLASRPVR